MKTLDLIKSQRSCFTSILVFEETSVRLVLVVVLKTTTCTRVWFVPSTRSCRDAWFQPHRLCIYKYQELCVHVYKSTTFKMSQKLLLPPGWSQLTGNLTGSNTLSTRLFSRSQGIGDHFPNLRHVSPSVDLFLPISEIDQRPRTQKLDVKEISYVRNGRSIYFSVNVPSVSQEQSTSWTSLGRTSGLLQ